MDASLRLDPLPTPVTTSDPVVVYDSGVGGLTVARHLARLEPSANLLYLADNAWFPYGDKSGLALRARIFQVLETVVRAVRPRAVVVACNTASTAAAAVLDEMVQDVPFYLVTPSIRPAIDAAEGAPIAVLATSNTARHSMIHDVIAEHARPGQVTVAPAMGLVHLAEHKLAGGMVDPEQVRACLDPVLPAPVRSAMAGVVLGCTHFPWLRDELQAEFRHALHWSDSAMDTARRVIAETSADPDAPARGHRGLWLTDESDPTGRTTLFARHGFTAGLTRARERVAA